MNNIKTRRKESFDKWKNEIYKETIDFINNYEYFIEDLSENELNFLIEVLDENIIWGVKK